MSDYRAITVVSPMCEEGEQKNQDRAYWFPSESVGVVCDGVTTSPSAEKAAEFVARFCKVLFNGSIRERLNVLADLLVEQRLEETRREIALPAGTSPAMQNMLASVAKENAAHGFQTTVVAMSTVASNGVVRTQVVQCGDSAFFALSPDGSLLTASIGMSQWGASGARSGDPADAQTGGHEIPFGPGDELLAKVVGSGKNRQDLLKDEGIRTPESWMLCRPIELRSHSKEITPGSKGHGVKLLLGQGDLLLAPKYLATPSRDQRFIGYCVLPFARMIRVVRPEAARQSALRFDHAGSVTAVLPDDFYTDHWQHFEDRYPPDTHFVLASDGFYRAFTDVGELWEWLKAAQSHLLDPTRRDGLLDALHTQLRARSSDDDISFVWAYPAASVKHPSGSHARSIHMERKNVS